MYIDFFYITQSINAWYADENGIAMMESVMLFPVLITLLLGTYDIGNGIVLSQKTITASQVAADLIARNRTMNTDNLNDIIEGSKLAFEPYSTDDYGVDIVSVEFNAQKNPVVLWRETQNMDANDEALASIQGLFDEGEGMIVVTVVYQYTPRFSHIFAGAIPFTEVAFTRGRRSSTVTWN